MASIRKCGKSWQAQVPSRKTGSIGKSFPRKFAGAAFMRQKMSHILCSLELVYYETEIGRQLTEDERLERYTNWDIGLNMETLNAYYYTAISQQEAEEQQSEVG